MGKLFKIIGIVVLLLGVALGIVLFTDFDAPKLGARLVRIAADAAGIELEVESFRLNLRKGLLLEGVVARTEANGEVMTASLDLLEVECRLLPLIRGEVVVERILLQSPRIEVNSSDPEGDLPPESASPAGEAEEEPAAGEDEMPLAGRPQPVSIGELAIVDAHFVSRSARPGGSVTEIADLDFQLLDFEVDAEASSAVVGITGRGSLSAAGVRLDERELSDLTAELVVENGRYQLSGVEATGRSGEVHVQRLEVDLRQDPYRYRVTASVRDVNLDTFLDGALGAGLGRANLNLDGTGEGPGLAGAVADVVLRLDAGSLPSVAAVQSIDRLLGTSLDRASYEATEIQLSLVGGRLEIEPFEIVTEIVRLGVAGTIKLERWDR